MHAALADARLKVAVGRDFSHQLSQIDAHGLDSFRAALQPSECQQSQLHFPRAERTVMLNLSKL